MTITYWTLVWFVPTHTVWFWNFTVYVQGSRIWQSGFVQQLDATDISIMDTIGFW
jgi:hypothetical protein